MAKKATLTDVSPGYQSNETLNNNFEALNEQFDNTLSRDGSTPNNMEADIDLDGNNLINAAIVDAEVYRLNGIDLDTELVGIVDPRIAFTKEFDTVADMVAYTTPLAEGDYLRVLDGNHVYEVVSGASDYQLTTANGDFINMPAPSSGLLNVLGFGAVEGGVTDNLSVFQTVDQHARNIGCKTFIPEGVWAINGEWQLDTDSHVVGIKGKTEIIQISSTMADNVITTVENTRLDNADTVSNVHVEGLIVNGDYTRNSPPYSGVVASGGCGISFANVIDGSIKDCHAKDCTKHGIDITSSLWNVSGDDPTTRPLGGCANILVKDCSSTNQGDDGITTHYSRNIEINNCHAYDSGDFYSVGNSNGLEIDDGSYDIRVFGGRYDRNSRGVQIKGHDYAPAAARVRLFGVTCENNSQNFVFLHDGFDSGPVSTSAYDVEVYGCVSVVPRQKNASGLDRRALNISEYGGILIDGFTIVGVNDSMPQSDPSYTTDASSNNMVAIFGNARDVTLKNIRFRYVEEATTLIQVNNTAKDVALHTIAYEECLGTPISITSGTTGVILKSVRANTTLTPTPSVVIDCGNSPAGGDYTIEDVRFSGYSNAYSLDVETYPLPFEIKRAVVYGSGSADPEGTYPATRGSIYHRDDGANSGLYVKETGINTSTGWVLK